MAEHPWWEQHPKLINLEHVATMYGTNSPQYRKAVETNKKRQAKTK